MEQEAASNAPLPGSSRLPKHAPLTLSFASMHADVDEAFNAGFGDYDYTMSEGGSSHSKYVLCFF